MIRKPGLHSLAKPTHERSLSMNTLIAFCGLNCAQCEAYLATQANDQAAKERVAAKWRQEFNSLDITVDSVTCDGCITLNGRAGGYCSQCPIRACGIERKVTNCAYCTDYVGCEKLAGFFTQAPAAKMTLDEIRRTL
jgi:hypothetical protein